METPVTTGPVVPPSPSAFPIFSANPSAQVGIGTGVPGSGTLHVVATPTTTHGAPPSAAMGTLQLTTTPMSMSQQQTHQSPVPASPGGMVRPHPHPQQSPTNFYGTLQSPPQPVTMRQVTLTPPGPIDGTGSVVQSVAMAQVGLQSPSVMVQVRLRITVEPLRHGRCFERSHRFRFTNE